jgi:UDP-N-acetylglucosamine 1-carboxyvinyltransferase
MTPTALKLRELKEQAAGTLVLGGPAKLTGDVAIQGAKNTALKLIPALAAFDGVFELENVPIIIDTLELLGIIEYLGATVTLDAAQSRVRVDTTHLENRPIPFDMTRRTTTAFYFAGALLGRFGTAEVGKPGGDEIGARPVDLHVQGFRDLGAVVDESDEVVKAELASVPRDAVVRSRMRSAGATVNILLAVAGKGGVARFTNVPADADTKAFFAFIRHCGIDLTHEGNSLTCHGPASPRVDLRALDAFDCPPDRNDAFTWLAAGALSADGVRITGVDCEDIEKGIEALLPLGVEITRPHTDVLEVRRPASGLRAPDGYTVIAGPSPEFHSDWAPFLQLVLTTAEGTATTIDTLHSNRVRQAVLLRSMGADVAISGGTPPEGVTPNFRVPPESTEYIVAVTGPTSLSAIDAEVGNDVRACATAVLAASQATGESRIGGLYALYRGYESFPERLRALGAALDVEST